MLFHCVMPHSGTVDEIIAFRGGFAQGQLSPSGLQLALPSCCFWRLGPLGTWLPLAVGDSSMNISEILCATDGPAPTNFFPSTSSESQRLSESMAAAVDTAFLRHSVTAAPEPGPAKSRPVVSAMQLFGSPVRASQLQPSQPHVTFQEKKTYK